MKLIVGLGNPGFRYRNTRHNVGFLVVKELAKKFKIPLKKRKYNGIFGEGSLDSENVILFMPETYMNLSGEAVKDLSYKKNIKPEDLIIVYDDIDLKFGSIRLRTSGSSGGHNGLESVIENLGTSEFSRLKIGIGKDPKPRDVSKFVLTSFDREERPILKTMLKSAALCVATWVEEGSDKAMARFNG